MLGIFVKNLEHPSDPSLTIAMLKSRICNLSKLEMCPDLTRPKNTFDPQ